MVKKRLVALGSAGLLLLGGCMDAGGDSGGSATHASNSPTSGSSTTGSGRKSLGAYYHQKLDWSACGDDRCASLRVPVDYKRPGGASVALAVEMRPASGDHPVGSLVVNPGGPGAPGDYLAKQATDYFGDKLLAAYNIVAFDPRGTGHSDPVDCLSDAQLDKYVAEDPDPDTPAETKAYIAQDEAFWRGCRQRSDALLDHVGTVDAAKDMDILRAALGQKKMDYFGFSYGTKLGATYADLFAKKVGRMVLDGALDLKLSARESALHQASGFQLALRSYVSDCVSKGGCFLGSTVAAGLKRIAGLMSSIEAKPLPTESGRTLTIGNAVYGIIAPLYAKANWPALDQGLQQALAGDGSTLMLLSDAYTSRDKDGSYSDNSLEAISVINCLDDPTSVPPSAIPKQYAAFEHASPTFGRVFAWGLAACWHNTLHRTDSPDHAVDAAGAPPIVVIGTTRDPATPYEEAVALAKELKSGVLLTRDGDGHTGYNRGNSCIDDAVHAYLIDGQVPKDGLRC